MTPDIFHFVFGMAANFDVRPFSLSPYLAIKSAVEVNNRDTVFFHYEFEPAGKRWEKAGFNEGAKKLQSAQMPVVYRADDLISAAILKGELNAFISILHFFDQEIFYNTSIISEVKDQPC